jgi:cellulose synthase/poly-beta-1,6-N-acetylglucosamine synthase-like glycosyltransferase
MSGPVIAFWLAAGFIGYTYVAYPLGVWLASCMRRPQRAEPAQVAGWPAVTIVVAAHNEASRLPDKLANLRALDYPRDRLQIVVVSDGSTDGSNELLRAQPDVRLVEYAPRRGKPSALNAAMQAVQTPIVVFSDARQSIEPKALRFLVARLLQPGVGAVSAELVHRDPTTHQAAHIGLYWRYEKWIRKSESRLASTVGVTGALYALRREDYRPLAPDTLLDDFETPMQIVRRGRRVVLENQALAYDDLQPTGEGELKRKARTLTGNFQAFLRHPWMFSPLHNPVFVQFVSHKVLRLLVPYALVAALVASALAGGAFYRGALVAQLLFYSASLLGLLSPRLRASRIVSFASVFMQLNWAAVLALCNYVAGRLDSRWEKTS